MRRGRGLSSLLPPTGCLDALTRACLKQSQLFQPLLTPPVSQAFTSLHGLLLGSLQYICVPLVLRSPEPDTTLQMWSHQSWREGKNHTFMLYADNSVFNSTQGSDDLLCQKSTLLRWFSRWPFCIPKPFLQACFLVSQSQHLLVHEFFPPKAQGFAFPFFDLLEDSVCPSHWGLHQQDFQEITKSGFTTMWVTYWGHHKKIQEFMSIQLIKYSLTSVPSTWRSHIPAGIMLPYCHCLYVSFLCLSLVRSSLSIHAG